MKIDSSHIEYIDFALRSNTSDVRNIRAFLITTIYRSFETADNWFSTKVKHDMAKAEAKRAFPQEAELQEKTKRLAAVEALLKMDKKDDNVIDTDVSDAEVPQQKREYAMAR